MSPPFVLSGHGIDPTLTPIYRRSIAMPVEIIVDNSAGQGIVAFGGWIFPIDGSADRGHIKLAKRENPGSIDTIIINDEYAAIIDPPDYVMRTLSASGNNFDAGTTAFNAGSESACLNIANGARWVTNAGIPRTVSKQVTIEIWTATGPDTCPAISPMVFQKTYTFSAVFTG